MLKYELKNLFRARWVYGYAALFWAIAFFTFSFAEGGQRALLALTHVSVLVAPLVSGLGAANAGYVRRQFDEFLLTQPVSRSAVFFSSALALLTVLVAAFALPVSVVCASAGAPAGLSFRLVGATSLLVCTYVMLGQLLSLRIDDRTRGLGLLLALWFGLTVVYDAALLYVIVVFEDFPIEPLLAAAVWANPSDAVRLLFYQDLGLRFLLPVTLPEWAVWSGLFFWGVVLGWLGWRASLRKDY